MKCAFLESRTLTCMRRRSAVCQRRSSGGVAAAVETTYWRRRPQTDSRASSRPRLQRTQTRSRPFQAKPTLPLMAAYRPGERRAWRLYAQCSQCRRVTRRLGGGCSPGWNQRQALAGVGWGLRQIPRFHREKY